MYIQYVFVSVFLKCVQRKARNLFYIYGLLKLLMLHRSWRDAQCQCTTTELSSGQKCHQYTTQMKF